MPDYSDLWRLKMPGISAKAPTLPTPPAIPPPEKYPEMDMGGLQDWLSSMMSRQLMPGRLTPERIGGITNQMLGPLMQMKAQYPFQKYGAEESARRWGAGMGADTWRTQYAGGLDVFAKQLMAMLQGGEMQMRERMAFPGLYGLEQYTQGFRGRG